MLHGCTATFTIPWGGSAGDWSGKYFSGQACVKYGLGPSGKADGEVRDGLAA